MNNLLHKILFYWWGKLFILFIFVSELKPCNPCSLLLLVLFAEQVVDGLYGIEGLKGNLNEDG